jgi:hypothetical protein
MSSSNRRTAATVYTNSLPAAPAKVAEQKSCTVNLPAQGSRERVTNTQKHRRRRRRRSSGENKNKTRLLKHTEKNDRQAQERLNLDLRKPQHKKKKQTNKACNDKKKYKKTLSYILTLKEGRCDCKQEKARDARFHS